jgi:hypothetical protein
VSLSYNDRLEDNIEINLKGICWEGLEWINLAHDEKNWLILMNTVKKLRFPEGAKEFLENLRN